MEKLEKTPIDINKEERILKEKTLPALAAKRTIKELLPIARKIKELSGDYLGEEEFLIDRKNDTEIRKTAFIEGENSYLSLFERNEKENTIFYDKYKKSFLINNQKISPGEIISSLRLGIDFSLDKNILESGEGKRLAKTLKEKKFLEVMVGKYSEEMARNLKEQTHSKDLLKSKAYAEIEKRSQKENSEQLGIKAEKIFIGLLESLSMDRSDLDFKVYEANPFQDVENKIDFILERKNKKRGVGVEENKNENLKTIGIQFTTATSKRDYKLDQIGKAKERIKEKTKDLDDIIYIEIDSQILRKAIGDWEKSNNKFSNPTKFLSPNIKNEIIKNLFKEILSEEEIKSLSKNI